MNVKRLKTECSSGKTTCRGWYNLPSVRSRGLSSLFSQPESDISRVVVPVSFPQQLFNRYGHTAGPYGPSDPQIDQNVDKFGGGPEGQKNDLLQKDTDFRQLSNVPVERSGRGLGGVFG